MACVRPTYALPSRGLYTGAPRKKMRSTALALAIPSSHQIIRGSIALMTAVNQNENFVVEIGATGRSRTIIVLFSKSHPPKSSTGFHSDWSIAQ